MPINAFVHVIESPSHADLLDGRTEGRTLCESLRLASQRSWYNLATSKDTFLEALGTRLQQAYEHHKVLPILHISAHGNRQGMVLTDGNFIEWDELRIHLADLNKWMDGWLLITMSVCEGFAAATMAFHQEQEPTYWALVGNPETVNWTDSAVAFTTFYHSLLNKDADLRECVRRMNVAAGDGTFATVQGANLRQFWLNRQTAPEIREPPPIPVAQQP